MWSDERWHDFHLWVNCWEKTEFHIWTDSTSGHQAISIPLSHVTDQYQECTDKMFGPGRKCAACCSDDDPPPKKWGVSTKTVESGSLRTINPWIHLSGRNTYDKADCKYVATLCSMQNYNSAFIGGLKNLWASSFKDHTSAMHARAMLLSKKQSSSDGSESAPIAKALHTLDSNAGVKLKRTLNLLSLFPRKMWHLQRWECCASFKRSMG